MTMMRTLVVSTAALLVLAGCGSAESSDDAASGDKRESTPSPSATASACGGTGKAQTKALARVDVNGDGTLEQVRLESRPGCPPALGVEGLGQLVATDLPDGQPPVRSAYGVTVPGRQGSLVVTRQDHPRGGYQLRVFALEGDELSELTVDGNAVFPFVATDVDEQPASIDCADNALVVTKAVPHEPVGVVAAWDVQRTTYTLEGGKVTAGAPEEVADNVLPKQLAAKYPELARHAAFTSCRVPA